MKMYARILFALLLSSQSVAWAQSLTSPVKAMTAMEEKLGKVTDFFGVMKSEKPGGATASGNFWVQGERFRISLEDRDLIGDGTFLWEVQHRDKKIKKRHYDPYTAPAIVQALRMTHLNLQSEHVSIAGTGTNDVHVEIETGSSIAQGTHMLTIDPNTHDITAFVLNENQGDYLERVEIGQLRTDLTFAVETFSVYPEDWKRKGYSLLDMAQGENFTIIPEEKALILPK